MISHKHKCIFIHIPATAGSAIEQAIIGKDWQQVDTRTKHMTPELSKLHYEPYWDEYFKFTIMRNPFDWIVSMFSKSRPKDLEWMNFEHFIVQFDIYKTVAWECPLNRTHIPLINNTIDLDYVGRFETLDYDFQIIAEKIGFSGTLPKRKVHVNKRDKDYKKYYNNTSRILVENIFQEDLEAFNYEF